MRNAAQRIAAITGFDERIKQRVEPHGGSMSMSGGSSYRIGSTPGRRRTTIPR
jgi:hypothetical protein